MPHLRKRHLEKILKRLMGLSPLVGMIGHRQVGKTTLLELLCQEYHTLDSSKALLEAQQNPDHFIAQCAGTHVAIDECQLAPDLFPALKDWVRKHKKPGQFILSGSVRFTSRKAIQESLTGRIITLELLPLLLSELEPTEIPQFWTKALTTDSFTESFLRLFPKNRKRSSITKYFEQGGLPGICFIRDPSFRERKLDTQIETILDRDLRKIVSTNAAYPQIRRLLQALADQQGELFNWSHLKKLTEISIPTLKKLVYGMEGAFLIRTVLVEGDYSGPLHYFEDMSECAFVRSTPLSVTEQIAQFLMIHIRGELSYSSAAPFRFFQYRTRGGVVVPLALQMKEFFLGVIPIENERPSRVEISAADSFLKRYARSKVVFAHLGSAAEVINDRKLLVPIGKTV